MFSPVGWVLRKYNCIHRSHFCVYRPYKSAIRDAFDGRAAHGTVVKTYSVRPLNNAISKSVAARISARNAPFVKPRNRLGSRTAIDDKITRPLALTLAPRRALASGSTVTAGTTSVSIATGKRHAPEQGYRGDRLRPSASL